MTGKLEIYRCPLCETVVEVLEQCGVELICCGREMQLLTEQSHLCDSGEHTPIVERTDLGIRVSIGAQPHSMGQCHYIKWVEVLTGGRCHRQFLRPGQTPEAEFQVKIGDPLCSALAVRYYCSLHGLFKADSLPILPNRQDMSPLAAEKPAA